MTNPAEEWAKTLISSADIHIGQGKPAVAKTVLEKFPGRDLALLKQDTRESILHTKAKSYRRLGDVESLETLKKEYGSEDKDRFEHEMALTRLARICSIKSTPNNTLMAGEYPGQTGSWRQLRGRVKKLGIPEDQRLLVIREALGVNIESLASLRPRQQTIASILCRGLHQRIENWEATESDLNLKEHRNALRAAVDILREVGGPTGAREARRYGGYAPWSRNSRSR